MYANPTPNPIPHPRPHPQPHPAPHQVEAEEKGHGLPTVAPPGSAAQHERRAYGSGAYGPDETALTPGRLSRSPASGSSTERSSLISPSSLVSPG